MRLMEEFDDVYLLTTDGQWYPPPDLYGRNEVNILDWEINMVEKKYEVNILLSEVEVDSTICWNLIPDSLDQVESQMDSNAIYYFEFQTWNLALQPT